MWKISKFAADHKVIIQMLLIASLFFGILSLLNLRTEYIPDVNMPTIYIITIYPGASPTDMEDEVIKPIEEKLATLRDMTKMIAEASDSVAVMQVYFNSSVNPDDMLPEVRHRLSQLRDVLPEGLQGEPNAVVAGAADVEVFSFSMSNPDSGRLLKFIQDDLLPELNHVRGVGAIQMTPDSKRRIRVKLHLGEMADRDVSALNVFQIIKMNNLSLPLGNAMSNGDGVSLNFSGRYSSIEDMKNLVVGGTEDGALVHLGDIADIEYDTQIEPDRVRVNGQDAFYFGVNKRVDGDIISICSDIKAILNRVDAETNGAFNIEILSDDSRSTNDSLSSVIRSGILGIIMAVLIIWLCLADGKATLIIALSIPLSFVLTLILFVITGRTLNILTLTGMVVALGMIVDGSIVMLEQVYRYLVDDRFTVKQSVYRGAREVTSSILASVLTTVVVFIPLALLGGIVGKLMRDVSLSLIYSMSASLVVAIVIIPMFIVTFRKEHEKVKEHRHVDKFFKSLENSYRKALSAVLGRRKTVIAVSVALFLLSLLGLPLVGLAFMNSVDANSFYISLRYPFSYTKEQTMEEVGHIENYLVSTYPEIDNRVTFIGSDFTSLTSTGSNFVSFKVNLVPVAERKIRTQTIANRVMRDLPQITPDAEVKVMNGGFDYLLSLASDGGGYGVTLSGKDMDALYGEAQKIKEELLKCPEVLSASVSLSFDAKRLLIAPVHDFLSSAGLTAYEAGMTSALLFLDNDAGVFTDEDGDKFDITVCSDIAGENVDEGVLSDIRIKALSGEVVGLSAVAELGNENSITSVKRRNRARSVSVKAVLVSEDTSAVLSHMTEYFEHNPIPAGIERVNGGMMEIIGDSVQPIVYAIIIAVFLVYAVMVIQFEEFRHPLIIMVCVPFCFIGMIAGLVLFGTTASLMTVLALVALSGTVVNNGIILVDYMSFLADRYRECHLRGLDLSVLEDANCDVAGVDIYQRKTDEKWELENLRRIIIDGCSSRVRPILMTVATTLAGVIPMSFDTSEGSELYAPLGQSIFLGLLGSTLITLFVVPVLYYIFERRKIKACFKN